MKSIENNQKAACEGELLGFCVVNERNSEIKSHVLKSRARVKFELTVES